MVDFADDKIDDAFTILNKTGYVSRNPRLSELDELAQPLYDAFDGEVLFDIYYSEPGLKGISFTEIFSQALLILPCNDDLRYSLALDALEDNDPSIASEDVLKAGKLDKYRLIPDRSREHPEAVIFLPGSNFIADDVDWRKVTRLVNDGAVLKPHPVTHDGWIKELERMYPGKILKRRKSGFDYLSNAKTVYTTYHSEIGLLGTMMDKEVGIVSPAHGWKRPIYRQIYDAIAREFDQKKALEKIMGSRKAGFMWKWHPTERAREIVDILKEAAKND